MRSPLRLALVVVGLAITVYGAASLTEGWLGTPPWWEIPRRYEPPRIDLMEADSVNDEATGWGGNQGLPLVEPRPGREWISVGVIAAGLGLVTVGVWPRRRRAPAES